MKRQYRFYSIASILLLLALRYNEYTYIYKYIEKGQGTTTTE